MYGHLIAHAELASAAEVLAHARAVQRRLRAGIAPQPAPPARCAPSAPVAMPAPLPEPERPRRAMWVNPAMARPVPPVPPVCGVRGEPFVPALLALVAEDAGMTGVEVTGGAGRSATDARLLLWLVCREATALDANAIAWLIYGPDGGRAARRVREGCASADLRRLVDDGFNTRAERLLAAATALTGIDSAGAWPMPEMGSRVAVPQCGGGYVRALVALAAQGCDVSAADVDGRSRITAIVRARQVAFWLIRTATTLSLPEIGRRMNGRDHSTVHHGIEVVMRMRTEDDRFRARTDAMMSAAVRMTGIDRRAVAR